MHKYTNAKIYKYTNTQIQIQINFSAMKGGSWKTKNGMNQNTKQI